MKVLAIKLGVCSGLLAGAVLFVWDAPRPVQAESVGEWEYNNGEKTVIGGAGDQIAWNISALTGGKAVTKGRLEFIITDVGSHDHCTYEEGGVDDCPKWNLFGMASDTIDFHRPNYFMKVRKDIPNSVPGGFNFGHRIELKTCVDCEWGLDSGTDDYYGATDYPESGSFDSEEFYYAALEWDHVSTTFKMWQADVTLQAGDQAVETMVQGDKEIEVWTTLAKMFAAPSHTIYFGNMGGEFYGSAATYYSIKLNAYELTDPVTLEDRACGTCVEYCEADFEDCGKACVGSADQAACEDDCSSVANDCLYDCDQESQTGDDRDDTDTGADEGAAYGTRSCLGLRPDPQSVFYWPPGPPMRLSWDFDIDWDDEDFEFIPSLDFIDLPNEFRKSVLALGRMSMENASISVGAQPSSADAGQEVVANVTLKNFKTKVNRAYVAYFINNIFANSILAGGTLPEHAAMSWGPATAVGPACQPVTRVPEIDTDSDGMDDDWERREFARPWDNNPCYAGGTLADDILACARPYDDPDDDGTKADRFETGHYDRNEVPNFAAADPEEYYLVPSPPAAFLDDGDWKVMVLGSFRGGSGSNGPFNFNLPDIVPDFGTTDNAAGFERDSFDDQKTWGFPNIMEYIYDLDPLDADTDEDGFGDEEDLLGVGDARQLRFTTESSPPGDFDNYNVRAIAVGRSQKDRVALVHQKAVVEIKDVMAGVLKVQVSADQKQLTLDKPFTLKAEVMGGENIDGTSMSYEWFIRDDSGNKLKICDETTTTEESRCGLGRDSWTITLPKSLAEDATSPLKTGDEVTAGVTVTDTLTGRQANGLLSFIIGAEGVFAVFDADSENPISAECLFSIDGNISEESACVFPYQTIYLYAPAVEDTNEYRATHLYDWWIDGERDQDQSGEGLEAYEGATAVECTRDDSRCVWRDVYKLKIKKLFGDKYTIKLDILERQGGRVVQTFEKTIPIAGPLIEIEGCDGTCSVGRYDTLYLSYQYANLAGMAEDRINPDTLDETWYINGERAGVGPVLAKQFSGTEGMQYVINFQLRGEYLNANPEPGEEELPAIPFSVADTVTITIASAEAATAAERIPSVLYGSLIDLLPVKYQLPIKLSALVFGLAFVIIIGKSLFNYHRWHA